MKCYNCSIEKHREGAQYCYSCGCKLDEPNLCTNQECTNSKVKNALPDNFAYCDRCGSKSSFLVKKYVKENDLPF